MDALSGSGIRVSHFTWENKTSEVGDSLKEEFRTGPELSIKEAIEEAKKDNITIPKADEHYRVHTLNNKGSMYTKFDPLTEKLIESIKENPKQKVFDVGGAYGNVAKACLDLGVETYYLNDCERRHLTAFARSMEGSPNVDKLHLILGKCPEEVTIQKNYFNKILVNKVLHFMNPDNLEKLVASIKEALVEGGEVYILTVSPHYKNNEDVIKVFKEKKEKREPAPGYFGDFDQMPSGKRYPADIRPKTLFFMDLDDLKALFENEGFEIVKSYKLDLINETNPEWKEGEEMVGIIAKKKTT